jgi:AcrR family transcriptional regulator
MASGRARRSANERSPGVGERLVETASALFYREGVRAVGIQRVIDEAGIAKASLYAHFDSKDDLVAACVDKRVGAWRSHVDEHLQRSTRDARGKLLLFFDLLGALIAGPEFRGCPLQSVSAEIADPNHPAKRVMAGHRQWLHDLLRTLTVEAGLRPVDEVAGALVVLSDGALAAALVDGNPGMAVHARWAAERLIDASRAVAPARRRRGARTAGH